MIRVNLLPQAAKQRSQPESDQTWMLVIMGLIVAEIVALFFFHQTKEDELAEVRGQVQQLVSQISDINQLVKDHKKVKEELKTLRAREDAIAKLQSGRSVPTAVLLEMSRVLTAGKGPTTDPKKLEKLQQENPLAIYDPSWNPKQIWLTKYAEAERSVRIEGLARDGGDVYEFAQRLKLSQYFDQVTLLPGKQEAQRDDEIDLVKFALQVKVRY